MPDYIDDWPGKSARDGSDICHPAAYHMLDAAAVAEKLTEDCGFETGLRQALIALVALHDIGKMTPSFRDMLRSGKSQAHRHWELSEVVLRMHDRELAETWGASPFVLDELIAAVSGHHGRPPSMSEDQKDRAGLRLGRESARATARFIEDVLTLWPGGTLAGMMSDQAKAFSWWLAGLTTAADWIGSNSGWFPATEAGPSLAEYLGRARERAEAAVIQAGIMPVASRDGKLFDFALRPMQSECATVRLPEGPMMVVIEDETGAGKTEAALILAQRMLAAGKGHGLFFALPTMATADAMFTRVSGTVGRMFDVPSVALAHGRAALSANWREVQGAAHNGEDAVTCAPWLADGRRRALLAQVGVGTIDQALLSVLPSRFGTLRHWGLSSKILVVDEVHEMGDPYMAVALEQLLAFHAARGGSAILMTATLPGRQRDSLLSAYASVSGMRREMIYPALVVGSSAGVTETSVHACPSPRGPVTVRRLADMEAAVALLKRSASEGAACVWVRNAVDDAIDATEALRAEGVAADLLHARFALCDRKAQEVAMLARFGKDGTGRAGRVLVATQVVESSLDLDFDVMVSDLAPMAALIQRAGRLWRHMDMRPTELRPVPAPVLHVLSPDPKQVRDDRWVHDVLDRGAWVYSVADQWRTASVLFDAGRIVAPSGLRALIEPVHGADPIEIPPALAQAEAEAAGENQGKRTVGYQNVVKLSDGYRFAGGGSDDRHYPTRLGVEQRVLVLARNNGTGGLRPWAGGQGAEAWMLSEVQAAARRLDALPLPDQAAPAITAVTSDWPEWKRREVRVCPVDDAGGICGGLRYDHSFGLIFSSM